MKLVFQIMIGLLLTLDILQCAQESDLAVPLVDKPVKKISWSDDREHSQPLAITQDAFDHSLDIAYTQDNFEKLPLLKISYSAEGHDAFQKMKIEDHLKYENFKKQYHFLSEIVANSTISVAMKMERVENFNRWIADHFFGLQGAFCTVSWSAEPVKSYEMKRTGMQLGKDDLQAIENLKQIKIRKRPRRIDDQEELQAPQANHAHNNFVIKYSLESRRFFNNMKDADPEKYKRFLKLVEMIEEKTSQSTISLHTKIGWMKSFNEVMYEDFQGSSEPLCWMYMSPDDQETTSLKHVKIE